MQAEELAQQLAQGGGGIVSRGDLVRAGVRKKELAALRKAKTIVEVLPRVFRHASVADGWEVQARAALRWAGPRAALCSASAAALLEIGGYQRAGVIHVAIPGTPRIPTAEGFELAAHCARDFIRWDVSERSGFRITSAERTLFDLASELDADAVERLVDEAIIKRRTLPHRLKACFKRLAKKGRKGTATLGEVLARRADTLVPIDSELELEFLKLFKSLGLPIPVTGTRSPPQGRAEYYIDFAYPQWRLAIEIQSKKHHSGILKRYEDDLKANVLTSRGWSVIRLWAKDKYEPQRVAELIRAAIAVRAPLGTFDYVPALPAAI